MIFWLSLIIFLTHVLIVAELICGSRKIINLKQIKPLTDMQLPLVSIVVAARNEERQIGSALSSLLAQDYPQLEVIVVDDRSDDGTPAILETMTAMAPRLKILRIDTLPEGWLGKNHALWRGSQAARGELILFTDADIIMAPDTLTKAVSLFVQQRLDHLSLSPALNMQGILLNLLAVTFGFFFALYTRPWRVPNPRSRSHIGIGAFNLVRAVSYHQVGGHQRIRLRPDDDLKLGKIIKSGGYRQQFAYGHDFIRVQWYSSVKEMIIGLEKNLFAGSNYRVDATLAGACTILLLFVWPYVALLLTGGAAWLLSLASVGLLSLTLIANAARNRTTPWHALGFPLAALLLCGISLRTMTINLAQGGITWRGTFYSLAELRRHRM